MSKISQHIINSSWEQGHTVVKNFITELLRDLTFQPLQGRGGTLLMDTNIAAI